MSSNILWHDRKRTFLGLPWSFTRYSLSEERLFISKGFFKITDDEVRLYRIMDISLTRTLGQRILNIGTIHCCSGDKTLKDFSIESIKNPLVVKEMLSDLIEKQRDAKRVVSRELLEHDEGSEHGAIDDVDDVADVDDADSETE